MTEDSAVHPPQQPRPEQPGPEQPGPEPSHEHTTSRRRGSEKALERLVAFGDAVVAIAITLIVLPLVDRAADAASVSDYFAENISGVTAAGISFLVVAVFWSAHHGLFIRAWGYTPWVLRLDFLWLAVIVFLPVATVLDVVSPSGQRAALGLYIGTLLVGAVIPRVQETLLRRAGLIDATGHGGVRAWLGAMLMGLVLIVALIFPTVGTWSLLLLLAEPLVGWIVASRSR